jgi:predicted DCC family thiol-disulfide oxidoreductase YuxK
MEEKWMGKHIVFFDGDCGVCNFWVQWILKRDKKTGFFLLRYNRISDNSS